MRYSYDIDVLCWRGDMANVLNTQQSSKKKIPENQSNQSIEPVSPVKNDDKRVLNIVMLGTGQHQSNVKSVLTQLYDQMEVSENQSKHLINGPGGQAAVDSKDFMLGTYDFSVSYDSTCGKLIPEKTMKKKLDASTQIAGNLTGFGFEDAINEALKTIEAMDPNVDAPVVLNMYGFSRGADTILRIANELNRRYGHDVITVNIFAIDPVPGAGRNDATRARIIPGNVKRYEAVLMEDERRPMFSPQDKSHLVVQNPTKTEVIHHLYSGNHSHGTRFTADITQKNETDKNLAIQDSARLIFDDIRRFNESCDVKLNEGSAVKAVVSQNGYSVKDDTISLDDQQRLQAYGRMCANKSLYAKTGQSLGIDRSFLKHKEDYFLHGDDFFQDKQHMLLFQKIYPKTFTFLFNSPSKPVGGELISAINSELSTMKSQGDIHLKLLQNKFKNQINDVMISPGAEPHGIKCPIEIYDDKEIMRIWNGLLEAYQAVRAGYDNSISKSEAKAFLKDIRNIIKNGENSEAIKNSISENLGNFIENHKKQSGEFIKKVSQINTGEYNIKISTESSNKTLDNKGDNKSKTLSNKASLLVKLKILSLKISNMKTHSTYADIVIKVLKSSYNNDYTRTYLLQRSIQYLNYIKSMNKGDDVNILNKVIQKITSTDIALGTDASHADKLARKLRIIITKASAYAPQSKERDTHFEEYAKNIDQIILFNKESKQKEAVKTPKKNTEENSQEPEIPKPPRVNI